MTARLLPLATLSAWVLALAIGAATPPLKPSAQVLQDGQHAPPFVLPLLDEPTRSFSTQDLLGRVWVLNLWASWCAPCRDEHPVLLQAARAQQVLLVGLSVRDDPRDASEWLLRLGNPYLATVLDRDGRVSRLYGAPGVPLTLVLDRQGIVRLRHAGRLTQPVWDNQVLPLVRRLQG